MVSNKDAKNLYIGGLFIMMCFLALSAFMVWGGNTTPGALTGVEAGTTEVSTGGTLTTFDASQGVTLGVATRESIADTTGTKNLFAGTAKVYKSGSITPLDTIVTTSSGFGTSTSGSEPGEGDELFVVVNNTAYYYAKSDMVVVPKSNSVDMTVYLDKLNTLSLTMQNSSSGNWQSTGMAQLLTTDEAKTLDIQLEGATARGVYRAPIICADYDINNFTRVEITDGTKINVPSGVASGFEECYTTDIDTIEGFNSGYEKVRLTPKSGVNPACNVTLRVIDYGNYVKDVGDILYDGYQNPDTLADVGATNYDFVIVVG